MTLESPEPHSDEPSEKPPATSGNVGDQAGIRALWSNIETKLQEARTEELNFASSSETYKLWVRWLHSINKSSESGDIFCSEAYWTLLQHGFQYPSVEQRRYCLYILGKSITLLDQDVNVPCFAFASAHGDFLEAYEKYCTLFSTFVIDRYINQVEECLPQLRDLATPTGQVDPSWVTILLGAALHHGIQDSVRKAVGEHFMQWDLTDFPATAVWPDFFARAFLPWACQGYLFTTSIIEDRQNTRCRHGDQLKAFVERLVHLCHDSNDLLSFSRLLLQYIVDSPKLFPNAGVYVLHGLLEGLKAVTDDGDELHFGRDERELALRVARRTDLPEMARNAWRMACIDLCRLNQAFNDDCSDVDFLAEFPKPEPSSVESTLGYFDAGQEMMHRNPGMVLPVPGMCSSMRELLAVDLVGSLPNFVRLIERTNHKCLQQDGLHLALIYFKRCCPDSYRRGGNPVDSVYTSMLAIWTEIEIQDYPKSSLMELPNIFFTDGVLNKLRLENLISSEDGPLAPLETHKDYPLMSDLHGLVLDIWQGLVRLCYGRIYVFASMTRALHRLCFGGCHWSDMSYSREATTSNSDMPRYDMDPPVRLPFNDFLVEVASKPPRSKVEFKLEAAIEPMLDDNDSRFSDYRSYYGEPEGVSYAHVFDLLNRQDFNGISMRNLLDRLYEPWVEQQQPILIVSKWKHTIQLQFILLLCQRDYLFESIPLSHWVEVYFTKTLEILAVEPMPRYRFLLHWIILTIYSKVDKAYDIRDSEDDLKPMMTGALLKPLRNVEQDNPKYMGSLLRICVGICKMKRAPPPDFALQLMTAMVAMCASPKIVIRHEAQWSFVALWDFAEAKQWPQILSNPILHALSEYIKSLDRYTNPPMERLLEEFDFEVDNTLTNLFQGDYLRVDPPEAPITTREAFIQVWKSEGSEVDDETAKTNSRLHRWPWASAYHTIDGKGEMPLGKPHKPRGQTPAGKALQHGPNHPNQSPGTSKTPLQTKASSWQTVLDNFSDPALTQSLKRHVRPIIVFASHIASAVNLGGLSRASEVFGAQALVVAKADIVKDKAFLGVSVNSHLHMPVQEVKPDEQSVLTWLKGRRSEGYGIVGVEQTDRSIVLGKAGKDGQSVPAFPRKCVLVMGSEKEGIPGWLLAECDAGCVEIPQVGVTRSLNVQTAAAVALYEYGRQTASMGN